jgi:thiamine-phosphate pyrophosphorylase
MDLDIRRAMTTEIFLIAPTETPIETLKPALLDYIAQNPVSAVLLERGTMAENAYKTACKQLVIPIQEAGAAVLVEGEPGLVRLLAADGLHVPGGIKAVREAVGVLKPNYIVGCGDIGTRHDAMQKAELDLDYILFGPLSGAITDPERELARWWAETMQIPSVLSDPEASPASFEAEGCEFIALRLPEPAK